MVDDGATMGRLGGTVNCTVICYLPDPDIKPRMKDSVKAPMQPVQKRGANPVETTARIDRVVKMVASLSALPDPTAAGPAACALLAAEFSDAGICLVVREAGTHASGTLVLADYPYGIGIDDHHGSEVIGTPIAIRGPDLRVGNVELIAWRSQGDRLFTAEDAAFLTAIAPAFSELVVRLIETSGGNRRNVLDPETGLWPLPSFLAQADRRFDRLDIEERVGSMFAIGWVRSDGAGGSEASAAVIRASAEILRDMLRPSDLLGRIGPTRLAAWCDGVDHLIAAERGDRIAKKLDTLLAGTGRHAAIGIASRWPRSGNDPATILRNTRSGLEQARLTAAACARAAVRIWQPELP